MSSMNGLITPSEYDISKLISFFQLHQNSAIINNNMVIAFDLWDHVVFRNFCGMHEPPYADPIIIQLRRALKLNAGYIWHEYAKRVCLSVY